MARIKPQALLQQSKKKKGPSRISVTTITLYGLIVLVMVFFLFTTYRHWSQRGSFISDEVFVTTVLFVHVWDVNVSSVIHALEIKGGDALADSKNADVPRYAIFNTSKGLITVELHKEGSPEIVDEFIDACQKGRFRGMPFNRVIKHFVIQGGGDFERHGATEDWTTRGKHYGQLDSSLKHEAFMLGTSKSKQKGQGFDIYITTAPIPDLNEKLNVFGQVIRGEDIVQEIEEVDTDEHYRPKSAIGIISVTLKRTI